MEKDKRKRLDLLSAIMKTVEEVIGKLNSTKSAERRRAAKEIGKHNLRSLGPELFESFLKEQADSRTWETQVEMMIALGVVELKSALPEIERIVQANSPNGMIAYAAAQTLVRIKRSSLQDANPVIELLKQSRLALASGALCPLAYDRMMPPN